MSERANPYEHPKTLWLSPACDGCGDEACTNFEEGRTWCQENIFDPCEECGREAEQYVLSTQAEALADALEFYTTAWNTHPGDSGPGGNDPQDPVCDPDDALLEDGGKQARTVLAAYRDAMKESG